MITCDAASERMPSVAAGRSTWSAEEAGHLRTCPACAAEWQLVSASAALGQVTGSPEPGAQAEALLGRLREAKAQDRRRRSLGVGGLVGLAVAAGLLAVVLAGPPKGAVAPPTPAVAVLDLPLAELDQAEEVDLEQVLAEFDVPLGDPPIVIDFDGVDVMQVERALRAWEES